MPYFADSVAPGKHSIVVLNQLILKPVELLLYGTTLLSDLLGDVLLAQRSGI
jgi:hypothetical protein